MPIAAGARATIDLTVSQWLDMLMADWLIDVDRNTDWYHPMTIEQEYERVYLQIFLWPSW